MASDKDRMFSTANKNLGLVMQAIDACDAAVQDLTAAQAAVSENWRGASGDAMAQALSDLKTKLTSASDLLSTASSQMFYRAWSIYDSWPEETEFV